MTPEPIRAPEPLMTKAMLIEKIALLKDNGYIEAADKLIRENKHILSPDIPLGAQEFLAKYITKDKNMIEVKRKIGLASKLEDTVLIVGPTGSGKELLAHALHGDREREKFISVNCAGLPSGLIESELFGHVKGSFTGATNEKIGMFAAANEGTIFLDEIGELPLEVQAKLLRVIQERVIRKVGSNFSESVNTRIVCATHQNLAKLVKEGKFREDLFWRISTLKVRVTGLDERPDDIPLIVDYWATLFESNYSKYKVKLPEQRFPRDFKINPKLLEGNVRSIISIIRQYHAWGELPDATMPDTDLLIN